MLHVRFSNRVSLSSAVFPSFVVITAWVALLHVVSPAIALAATNIGRIGLESLALGRVAESAQGHKQTSETGDQNVRFTPESRHNSTQPGTSALCQERTFKNIIDFRFSGLALFP